MPHPPQGHRIFLTPPAITQPRHQLLITRALLLLPKRHILLHPPIPTRRMTTKTNMPSMDRQQEKVPAPAWKDNFRRQAYKKGQYMKMVNRSSFSYTHPIC